MFVCMDVLNLCARFSKTALSSYCTDLKTDKPSSASNTRLHNCLPLVASRHPTTFALQKTQQYVKPTERSRALQYNLDAKHT